MKTIKQIEKEINRQLDKLDKCRNSVVDYENSIRLEVKIRSILTYINGMGFVLDKKERLAISDATRERLLKATKEYRNGKSK